MNKAGLPAGLEHRKEDIGLITGTSHYVDDIKIPGNRPPVLYMVVVRSPYAHAAVKSINLDKALALQGVIHAFTGAELVNNMPALDVFPLPGLKIPERRPFAVSRVRYVGDPVAVILAENPYIAEDAKNLVEVEYDILKPIVDPESASAPGAPLLYEEFGTNIALHSRVDGGNVSQVFGGAAHSTHLRLTNQRIAPSSMEARACLFDFVEDEGILSGWVSSQATYLVKDVIAGWLGIERSHIVIHNAEVGGGFGGKINLLGEEIIAALLAYKYSRPIKWIEGRSENLQALTHGRGQINYVEAAYEDDGLLLGLRVRSIVDFGAFLTFSTALVPSETPALLSGPYRIRALESQLLGVFTNKVPTAAYRGAGRPEATYILERTMDRIAHELGIDPVEVRRRNLISHEEFPYRAITGITYDSGNYQLALDRALELADYEGWRRKQREQRGASGSSLLGIGLSTFIEISGGPINPDPTVPQEAATVRICRDGTILVLSGVAHNGQGHFTAFAQIAAEVFSLPGSRVVVRMNETNIPAYGFGTFGSRTLQVAGSAIFLAAKALREKALQVAAKLLEVPLTDVVLEGGSVKTLGLSSKSIDLGELARIVEEQPNLIQREPANPDNGLPIEGLAAWHDFNPPDATFSSGTHVAVVDVDTDTGEVEILAYIAVDDCGKVLNNYLVEAQLHGGIAQGIGQALYEEVIYDSDGQLITGTLMDYTLPRATHLPVFTTDLVETPSPRNPLGAKGVGEAGCIAAPPAVVNAVLDALAPLSIKSIDMPLKPAKIWSLIRDSRQGILEQEDSAMPSIFDTDSAQQGRGDIIPL